MEAQARTLYRLETFGGLSVSGGEGPLTGAATQRRTLALLATLAAAGEQGITREKLLGLFWPESDSPRARHALKQALYTLRRDLRDAELVLGTATLRLNPASITSDVQEFEQALSRGELERAAELHRGPFLDGCFLEGAPEFERWVERERGRLRHLHATVLERLALAARAAGDHARAVVWWRRLAAADPLSSRIATELMSALVAAGDPEAALQHARVHEALVRQELETQPDPAVAELAERVRDDLRLRRDRPQREAPVALVGEAAPEGASDAARNQAPPLQSGAPAAGPGAAPDDAESGTAARPPARFTPRRRLTPLHAGAALALIVAVVAVVLAVSRAEVAGGVPRDVPAHRSVAVLPFVNMSADSDNQYFSDGLSEELITALSGIDGLRVAARTSSFALREAKLDVRAIGDTLGVTTVVEGSVRRVGDRLRVTAQLIDATTGYHLWAEEYDRELRDIFALQDEIAGAIAGALKVTLAGRGGATPAAQRTASLEAYDLYLRGVFFRNRLTPDALAQSIAYFDRAIALDSGYALAYAGKATALGPVLYYGYAPREQVLPQMRAATSRALELDSALGEAHAAAGIISFFYEWDWPAAEREFRRATELNPGDPHAFHHLANYMRAMGRFDEAIAERTRALQLDPLNARTGISLGRDYAAAGMYERAMEQYRRAIEIDPSNPLALGLGPPLPAGPGEIYERRGADSAAIEEYLRVASRRGATREEQIELRRAYAAGGMRAFWRRWLAFDQRDASPAPNPIRMAAIWARIGDTARTFEWLERAHRERNPGLVYLAVDPDFESVRAYPRVVAILRAMRLRR